MNRIIESAALVFFFPSALLRLQLRANMFAGTPAIRIREAIRALETRHRLKLQNCSTRSGAIRPSRFR